MIRLKKIDGKLWPLCPSRFTSTHLLPPRELLLTTAIAAGEKRYNSRPESDMSNSQVGQIVISGCPGYLRKQKQLVTRDGKVAQLAIDWAKSFSIDGSWLLDTSQVIGNNIKQNFGAKLN